MTNYTSIFTSVMLLPGDLDCFLACELTVKLGDTLQLQTGYQSERS